MIIPKEVLHFLSLETDPKKHPLLIIVDELGYMPHFLRALCSMGVEVLEKEVQERLRIKNPCSFIAGGTGAGDTNTMKQEAYQLCFMPNDETKVWDQLVAKSLNKENVSSVERALAGVLVKNDRAKKLATNPRLAALMHNKIFGQQTNNDFWSVLGNEPRPRALESVLPEFFTQSVRKFRSLNAMASVDTKLMWKVYRSALAIVFFQELDRTCPTMLRQLVAGYGVVVDRAYVAKERNKHSSQGDSKQHGGPPRKEEDGAHVFIPQQRYTLSRAQVELFRMGYGFETAPLPSGEGFASRMCHFLEVLLLAANEIASLGGFLAKLGLPTTVANTLIQQRLDYKGVSPSFLKI